MLSPETTGQTKVLLKDIQSPADLRELSMEQLSSLAEEIRRRIITTVSKNGGHLAPSLGVVELTLALHHVFNTPDDKLIWDVGHQSYAHKLLTGRQNDFHTLRQYKGLSGFPKKEESEYDAFETGHAATSISAALGMTMAKDLKHSTDRAIAVIGDGSMTSGMAFEALNHAGDLNKNLIVILNDNEMSISPNVGAISSFLSRKLSGRTMRRVKNHLEERLQSLSNVGENILNVLKKSEESFKSFFTPGMLFEAFKFDYIGPIPGHQLNDLIEAFEMVRDNISGPVLIHVLTTKGKGYPPAENDPGIYHGLGPFDIESGKPLKSSSTISYTEVFGKTMVKMAADDNRLAAISAAMVTGTGLTEFARLYPERFFDVGIAEQHAVTFAAGLAAEGLHPVVAIYSSFFQRAIDQIIHDVCIPNLPVTLAIDRSGVVGDDGSTHHGVFDISYLRFIPNMVLMAPKDERELQNMLYTAVQHGGPTAVRYPRGSGFGVELVESLERLEIGKGELLHEGDDILLLPVGNRVYTALEAVKGLQKVGIQAAVINPRFIKPLDGDLICDWAAKTKKVLTIEDNCRQGGFGSSVLELFSRRGLYDIKTCLLAHPDLFIEHGPQEILLKNNSLDTTAIIRAAIKLMK
ncbi:1-deoxy-D-xylulose-5-phosphate synthase [Desulfopila inferna]|uniref:1-deoxy-D-xylulose-5-phosphate synthase n=1 Tax=Desulfopila inferna TaxID=468528 RepID=UPI0019667AA5|nr:1-deoxy-D-xylulose-5-phosphate synthase [Desulfopila inferna]MBM9605881.1 1-deoxy-D-xylulose-5-phosphate synthase [Desulfopila inferna]